MVGGVFLYCAAQQIALSAVLDVPVVQNVTFQERWHFQSFIRVREIEVYVVRNLIYASGSLGKCDYCRFTVICGSASDASNVRLVAQTGFRYCQFASMAEVQATGIGAGVL